MSGRRPSLQMPLSLSLSSAALSLRAPIDWAFEPLSGIPAEKLVELLGNAARMQNSKRANDILEELSDRGITVTTQFRLENWGFKQSALLFACHLNNLYLVLKILSNDEYYKDLLSRTSSE
jgi:hypothetical protein